MCMSMCMYLNLCDGDLRMQTDGIDCVYLHVRTVIEYINGLLLM